MREPTPQEVFKVIRRRYLWLREDAAAARCKGDSYTSIQLSQRIGELKLITKTLFGDDVDLDDEPEEVAQ